jgi:hypothetical protein
MGSMTLPIEDGGTIALEATGAGALVFDSLELPLGDVVLPPSAQLPQGLHLTDVKLSLSMPTDTQTTWTDDDNATATMTADLLLDWSDVTESGTIVPLETVKIAAVPITLDFAAGDVHLDVVRSGTFWDWAGLAKLSDLDATLSAHMPSTSS